MDVYSTTLSKARSVIKMKNEVLWVGEPHSIFLIKVYLEMNNIFTKRLKTLII